MYRRVSLTLVTIPLLMLLSGGCERSPSPPPPTRPATTTTPAAPGSTDLNRFLEGQGSAPRQSQPPGAPAAHPPTAIPTPPPAASSSDPTWDVPEGWTTVKATGMRRAQYTIPRAEGDSEDGQMLVFYFGAGQGGAVDANLKRWRDQVTTGDGQPVPDSDVKSEVFDANGMKVTLLQVDGRFDPGAMPGVPATGPRDNYRMLAAVVETPRGPWFFKATGPKATMEKHADVVRAMLKSVRR